MAADPILEGIVAVVTGGAGHLGTAMTTTLARLGASVVVADVDGARAATRAKELERDGYEAIGVEADVASDESVAAAFAIVADRFGGVDVLVNNAAPTRAVADDGPALEVDLGTWRTILDGILGGSLICTRHAIPSMIERGGGSIVNVAAVHAHAGDLDLTAYPAAKAGLVGLTRSIATQYGRLGVRCNSVSPGTIPYPSSPPEWRARKLAHQLVPREGRPEDVANVVAFLASPASAFVTGVDLPADGGVLAHLPAYADPGARIGSLRENS